MPDPAPTSSVTQTGMVALNGGGSVAILIWLCKPTWPPPPEIIAIASAMMAAPIHIIGRGIQRRLTAWAGPDDTAPAPIPLGVLAPGYRTSSSPPAATDPPSPPAASPPAAPPATAPAAGAPVAT